MPEDKILQGSYAKQTVTEAPPKPGQVWNPRSKSWEYRRLPGMGETPKQQTTTAPLAKFVRELEGKQVLGSLENLVKGYESTIPIEQIKGDIARKGYDIQRVVALDVDAHRMFFVDKGGAFLYAQYAGPDEGHTLLKVGFQKEVAKEYDPTDFEHSGSKDTVVTEHEEVSADDMGYDSPGLLPGGTPVVKPEVGEDQLDAEHDVEGHDVADKLEKARQTIGQINTFLRGR